MANGWCCQRDSSPGRQRTCQAAHLPGSTPARQLVIKIIICLTSPRKPYKLQLKHLQRFKAHDPGLAPARVKLFVHGPRGTRWGRGPQDLFVSGASTGGMGDKMCVLQCGTASSITQVMACLEPHQSLKMILVPAKPCQCSKACNRAGYWRVVEAPKNAVLMCGWQRGT